MAGPAPISPMSTQNGAAIAALGRLLQEATREGASPETLTGPVLEAALAVCPTARRAVLARRTPRGEPEGVAAQDPRGELPLGLSSLKDVEAAAAVLANAAARGAELGPGARAAAIERDDGAGALAIDLAGPGWLIGLFAEPGDPLVPLVDDADAREALRVLADIAGRALSEQPIAPGAPPPVEPERDGPSGRRDGDARGREPAEGDRRPVGRGDLEHDYPRIIGRSRKLIEVLRVVDRAAQLDVPVLVQGETGTGKELIARAIHENGPRAKGPLITINAAALAETLLESELFGYAKGAFTGADRDKQGLFELANGGTLFLDEIGEMPLEMQKKLLRVLQESEVMPLGARAVVPVDVRIIVATNRDLLHEVEAGNFRQDLFYRLSVISIALPPLRERRDDVIPLIEHFLESIAQKRRERASFLDRRDPRPRERLIAYAWPGNIRELENVVTKMVSLAGEVGAISFDMLPPEIRGDAPDELPPRAVRKLQTVLDEAERDEIVNALRVTGGNRVRAAKLLGVNRRTLLRRLAKHGLQDNVTDDDDEILASDDFTSDDG